MNRRNSCTAFVVYALCTFGSWAVAVADEGPTVTTEASGTAQPADLSDGSLGADEPAVHATRVDPEPPLRDGHEAPSEDVSEQTGHGYGDTWLLLPLVAYTPETSVLGAIFGSTWWKPNNTSQIDEVCSWGAAVIYTARQQFIVGEELELHFEQGAWQFNHAAGYSDYVDEWFGIGPSNTGRSESFDYTEVTLDHSVRRRIVPSVYLSVLQRLTWTRLDRVEEGGEFDRGIAPGRASEVLSGPGLGFDWDTRDRQNNPRRGHLMSMQASMFARSLGTTRPHGRLDLDVRGFVPVASDHVVATQVFVRVQPGAPGFSSQAEMGGRDLQRGIFEGRWRDRNLWAVQMEYRAPLVWRLGAVGFGGIGNVFDDTDAVFDGGLKWSVGGGLRFALAPDEGVNLRLDYGRGAQGESGFYVSIREAF